MCMFVYVCVCVFAYVYVCVCMCVCVCVPARALHVPVGSVSSVVPGAFRASVVHFSLVAGLTPAATGLILWKSDKCLCFHC